LNTFSQSSTTPAERLLRDVFHFDKFLPFQKQIIDLVLQGKDLLGVLPTGSGKSLCFQVPALLRKGPTVVISPLIALMKDQIDGLRQYSLPVEFLNSSLTPAQMKAVLDSVRAGLVRIVYISPERLRDPFFLHAIRSLRKPPLWVVDEAHCITEWGHDFRTDYLFIPEAIELTCPESQLIMFTATATPIVREDILRQMKRPSATTVCGSFDRPNLYLGCRIARTRNEKLQTLLHLLRKPGAGIVYTATRRQCETVCRFLQESGFNTDFYHAGRSAGTREEVHERFMADDLRIVAATNAFGMGLNKPDIRFIIHYAHPASIDAYYQEIGRGGRDGGRCDCILLFSPYDRNVQEKFISSATPSAQAIADYFRSVCPASTSGSLIASRREYEERSIEFFELEKAGVLARKSIPSGRASIYLSRSFERARAALPPMERSILDALDDSCGISRSGVVNELDLYGFCRDNIPECEPFALEQSLLDMTERGLIVYRPDNQDIRYHILSPSVSKETIHTIDASVTARRKFKMDRLETMVRYGSWKKCLRSYLLGALADPISRDCGFCDNC